MNSKIPREKQSYVMDSKDDSTLDPSANFFEYAESVCRLLSEQATKINELLHAPQSQPAPGAKYSSTVFYDKGVSLISFAFDSKGREFDS